VGGDLALAIVPGPNYLLVVQFILGPYLQHAVVEVDLTGGQTPGGRRFRHPDHAQEIRPHFRARTQRRSRRRPSSIRTVSVVARRDRRRRRQDFSPLRHHLVPDGPPVDRQHPPLVAIFGHFDLELTGPPRAETRVRDEVVARW